MAEEEPTARLYISLLTHLSASLICLQSADNNPCASCCRSFREALLPPPTTSGDLAVLFLVSTSWKLLQAKPYADAPCEGDVVKSEVRNSRFSDEGHASLPGPSAAVFVLKHAELCSLHLPTTFTVMQLHVVLIYLLFTPSRSSLLHRIQGKYLLPRKGPCNCVATT